MTWNNSKLKSLLKQTAGDGRVTLLQMKTKTLCLIDPEHGVQPVVDKFSDQIIALGCGCRRTLETPMTEVEKQELVAFLKTDEARLVTKQAVPLEEAA
jgi:hypothetical protein